MSASAAARRRRSTSVEIDGWEQAGLVVVASHFPILSEASRVAAAGLPYAGDLVNRADLEAQLRSDPRPKLVLSGHIHARCSTQTGRCCSSRSAP